MNTMKKLLAVVSVAVAAASSVGCIGFGCGGVPGNNDQLVFGSAVSFQGVDPMMAPVAAGSKFIVAVEATHGATQAQNSAVLAGMQLRAASASGAPLVTAAMGPGRWTVTIPAAGSYRLSAVNASGSVVDTYDLRATAASDVSFDEQVTVVTRGTRADGSACEVRSEATLGSLVLRANQEAHVVTVATAQGARLAGMLDLDLTGTEGATLRAVAAGAQVPANTVAVSATGVAGEGIALDVLDRATGRHATARIATAAGDAEVACPAQ